MEIISPYFQILRFLAQSHSRTQLQQQGDYKSSPKQAAQFYLPRRLTVSHNSDAIGKKNTLEIDIRMIEQENFDWAAIVLIDYSGTSINKILHSYTSVFLGVRNELETQSRTRRDAPVCSLGTCNRQIGGNKSLSLGRHNGFLSPAGQTSSF